MHAICVQYVGKTGCGIYSWIRELPFMWQTGAGGAGTAGAGGGGFEGQLENVRRSRSPSVTPCAERDTGGCDMLPALSPGKLQLYSTSMRAPCADGQG